MVPKVENNQASAASESMKTNISTFERNAERLALNKIEKCKRILKDDKTNLEAWRCYLDELFNDYKQEYRTVCDAFDEFLELYPNNGEVYLLYIKYELRKQTNDEVTSEKLESLFQKSLINCLNLNLWIEYIQFIKKKNNVAIGGQTARANINKAYDIALANISVDLNAGSFWLDYIKFIDSWTPATDWDEKSKIEQKRNAFKTALSSPYHNLTELWELYAKFEDDTSHVNSAKNISLLSSQYMLSKSWYQEFTAYSKNVNLLTPKNKNNENKLSVDVYKIWINLEKQNRLSLTSKKLYHRINYSYFRTLEKYPHYADIWYEYAWFQLTYNESNILQTSDKEKENKKVRKFLEENYEKGIETLKQSLNINPNSLLLTVFISEIFELKQDSSSISNCFETFIKSLTNTFNQIVIDESYLNAQIKRPLKEELVKETKRNYHNRNNNDDSDDDDDDDGMMKNSRIMNNFNNVNDSQCSTRQLRAENTKLLNSLLYNKKKLMLLITYSYVNYIKIANRSVKKQLSRQIFKEARKNPAITWHIFHEQAMFEYYTAPDFQAGCKIALKIFDIGLLSISLDDSNFENYEYLLKYFEFVVKIVNDSGNIKAVFEECHKILTSGKKPKTDSDINVPLLGGSEDVEKNTKDDLTVAKYEKNKILKSIYELYFKYELFNGTLDSVQRFQSRYMVQFPKDSNSYIFSNRFKGINDLNLINTFDLGVENNKLFNGLTRYTTNVDDLLFEKRIENPTSETIESSLREMNLILNSSSVDYSINSLGKRYGTFEEEILLRGSSFSEYNYGIYDKNNMWNNLANKYTRDQSGSRKRDSNISQLLESLANRKKLFTENQAKQNSMKGVLPKPSSTSILSNNDIGDTGKGPSELLTTTSAAKKTPFIGSGIYELLGALPPSDSFDGSVFDSNKIVSTLSQLPI